MRGVCPSLHTVFLIVLVTIVVLLSDYVVRIPQIMLAKQLRACCDLGRSRWVDYAAIYNHVHFGGREAVVVVVMVVACCACCCGDVVTVVDATTSHPTFGTVTM